MEFMVSWQTILWLSLPLDHPESWKLTHSSSWQDNQWHQHNQRSQKPHSRCSTPCSKSGRGTTVSLEARNCKFLSDRTSIACDLNIFLVNIKRETSCLRLCEGHSMLGRPTSHGIPRWWSSSIHKENMGSSWTYEVHHMFLSWLSVGSDHHLRTLIDEICKWAYNRLVRFRSSPWPLHPLIISMNLGGWAVEKAHAQAVCW
jgi:hypothetical protein